jgi:hypothetical protein
MNNKYNTALIMFAVLAVFGIVMATATVLLPLIQQAHAKGQPGCFFTGRFGQTPQEHSRLICPGTGKP